MRVFFQLLDRSSGNVIKDFPSEEAALRELRNVTREYGIEEIRTLALLRFQDGHPRLVAMDEDLIAPLNHDPASQILDHRALTHS